MARLRTWPLLALIIGQTSCGSRNFHHDDPSIVSGMTRAELIAAYGRPLRKERTADGGEDWCYDFGERARESRPFLEEMVNTVEYNESPHPRELNAKSPAPRRIHLSPEGRVVRPK